MIRRILTVAGLALLLGATLAPVARAQTEQQELVDRATLTAQDMLNDHDGRDAQSLLKQSRAVLICPRVFRAGFIIGGSGGSCVLVARDGGGSWSSPAFYSMGSGSIGFQAGIQDAEVMMMILTDRGLNAMMDSQFKLGADADIAFFTVGGGVEGATTAAVGADIVAFARPRGLFGSVSLSGGMISSRTDWNQAYYGQPLAARQIVVQMAANNPAANPLRSILTRYGAPAYTGPVAQAGAPAGYPPQPPYPPAPAYAPPAAYGQPVALPPPGGTIQQQSLPPPQR
jgi:lipid-binding SYLF domain-containing protein